MSEESSSAGKSLAEKLNASIPKKSVKEREGGWNPKTRKAVMLSYVDQFYIIDELNQIFGGDQWSFEVMEGEWIQRPIKETVEKKNRKTGETYTKDQVSAMYAARVRITLKNGTRKEGSAVGHTIGSTLGDVAHATIAEAETDALKRAARLFGRRLGLALYDKSQTFIDSDEEVSAPKKKKKPKKYPPDCVQAGPHAGKKLEDASLEFLEKYAARLDETFTEEHHAITAVVIERKKEETQ